MGKQKIIIMITVLFVTVSGIFYSVSYEKREEAVFIAEETVLNIEDTSEESLEEMSTEKSDSAKSEEKSSQSLTEEAPVDVIYVHICGQVKVPGVYCLSEESRVTDLVAMAGGFTENAARDYVNQAQKLSDGEKIYVPSMEEISDSSLLQENVNMQQSGVASKVNINTADKAALMELTGIGESKAAAIIKYREEHGSFRSIDELKQIEGIKDGVFNKIKDEITV